jgi:predicted RNA binding protein YcfA (HicA-like mRNA interferase family)
MIRPLPNISNDYEFSIERRTGSHAQLKHKDGRRVTVPIHANRPLKPFVMKSIIMQAKASEQEFLNHL